MRTATPRALAMASAAIVAGLSLAVAAPAANAAGAITSDTLRHVAPTNTAGDAVTMTDMLQMQQQIRQWSIMTQLQSTIAKDLADALKSVIQRSA